MRTHRHLTPHTSIITALVVALLCISTVFFSPLASAHHGKPHINWEDLDLSDEQTQRLHQLDAQWAQTYNRLHPQIKQDQFILRKLMESPDGTPEAMMRVQNRLERNRHQLHTSATHILMQKKQSLTDDQRQQLHDMMAPATTATRGIVPAGHHRH